MNFSARNDFCDCPLGTEADFYTVQGADGYKWAICTDCRGYLCRLLREDGMPAPWVEDTPPSGEKERSDPPEGDFREDRDYE